MIIYIYMFLLLDGDNDKLPIVGMARGSSFFFKIPQEGCDDHQKQFLSEKAREGWEPTTDSLG